MARPRRPRRRRWRTAVVAVAAGGLLVAGGATLAVTAAHSGDDSTPPAAVAPTPPPLTIPGPDGEIPAQAATSADLRGIPAGARAATAQVGDVTVASVPGGWTELATALDDLRGSFHSADALEVDGQTVGVVAAIPTDLAGLADRWVLIALDGSQGPRAVVLHGPGASAEDYARALAARPDQHVVPVPDGVLSDPWG